MKIITFLFANARTHIGKSLGFIFTIILLIVLSVGLSFVYKNISSAVTYYSFSSIVDPTRVEITADSNLLTLFSEDAWGIWKSDLDTLLWDTSLKNIEIFTLIKYPVLAKFSLFSFGLETDIPVFALSWGTLGENEIGISRNMLDYYNAQFAGSAVEFPEISEKFLIGQPVVVTVGESKLFNVTTNPATPINARIASIHPDYPWFWLVLREDTLKSRLDEIWQSLGNPYKITAYMQNPWEKEILKEKYHNLTLSFDSDKINELQEELDTLKLSFLVIFTIVWGIISVIILFLLGGIFRESRSIYRMIGTFGIFTLRSRLLTLWEPILLMVIGTILGWIITALGMNISTPYLQGFLSERWLIFPFVTTSPREMLGIVLGIFIVLALVLLFLDQRERKRGIL